MKNAMAQFRSFLDKVMQTNGNGVLGDDQLHGVRARSRWRSHPGRSCLLQPDDSGVRSDADDQPRVVQRDRRGSISDATITVDSVPSGTSANDVIVHDGLTGAQPVSLFGILYHQTNATTGTWLNLNRATYPVELATPNVNANNSALTPGAVRLAINKVRKALGTNQVQQADGLHVARARAPVGTARRHDFADHQGRRRRARERSRSAVHGEKTMAGVPIKSTINANSSRVDFLDLSHWGRAVMQDIDFYDVGGQTVFPIYGTSGGHRGGVHLLLRDGIPGVERSPRTGAYIDNLAIPSGY